MTDNDEKQKVYVSNVSNDPKPNNSIGNEGSSGNEGVKLHSIGIDDKDNPYFQSIEKSISKVMFQVSNVSNVSNVSDEVGKKTAFETNETNETCNTTLTFAFGVGVLDNLFSYFFSHNNAPITTDDLAETLKKTKDIVRVTINRNKEFFQEIGKEEETSRKLYCLSPLGVNYCNHQIEDYNKKMEELKNQIIESKKNRSGEEELIEQTKNLLSVINLKEDRTNALINFKEVSEWNPDYAQRLLEEPSKILKVLNQELIDKGYKCIRIRNLPKSEIIPVEKVRSIHIDKLICIEGRCVSLSTVRPIIKHIRFECPSCGNIISIIQNEKNIKQPERCSCGRRGGFKETSKDVEDVARIILEDLQEKTDNPNTQRLDCVIQGELTSPENIRVFTPGEELKVVGIVRETKKIVNQGISTMLGISLEIIDAEKIEEEVDINQFSFEDIKEIKSLASQIDKKGMSEINKSFAPQVHGYEQQKNAIILQCCNKKNDPKKSAMRNKISILMIGDPGIAKTVLGKFAVSITPNSKMAAGGGSSAVGITASVVKEDESMGGYRVEPGAMVLAKELLFLDEMNNITDEDKPKLQQGMSEQQISINKANLHVNLKVQGGMLATANPIKGHFQEGDVATQFNIPSPILNRFDVIFVMRDIVNEERDGAIAEIMIKRRKNLITPKYSPEFLRKFFVYVRAFGEPEIPDEITQKVKKIYTSSRRTKSSNVIINPRFMESLTRLMEASAKIRLSTKVEEKDVERALEILSQSHFQVSEYKNFSFS